MSSETFIRNTVSTSIFLIASLAIICCPPPLRSYDDKQQSQPTQLSARIMTPARDEPFAAREKLNRNCINERGINHCQGQKDEYVSARNLAKNILLQHAVLANNIAQSSDTEAEQDVEKHLEKIQELKRAWYRLQGLEHIEPADDGLWQGDVILSEDQADFLTRQIEENSKLSPEDRQKRAASTFFEEYPRMRWTMPIHFWISSMLSESHREIIRSALSDITAAVPCIEFYEDSTELTSSSQLQYKLNADIGCGGVSAVGRLAAQQEVHLGSCSIAGRAKGVVLHETIHALGGSHEHSRADRDEYIKIIWKNIDPQKLHNYYIALGTSTYGVRYDYNSVMHYRDGVFARSPGLPTMIPLHDTNGVPLGTQSVLTEGDVLQLERMYCLPETCADLRQECGAWAIDGYCENEEASEWMKTFCSRSCSFCEDSE